MSTIRLNLLTLSLGLKHKSWRVHEKTQKLEIKSNIGRTAPCLIAIYVNECGDSDIEKTICLTESVQTLISAHFPPM